MRKMLLFVFFSFFIFGCASVQFVPKTNKPVLMNSNIGRDFVEIGSFNKEYTMWWLAWGLVPIDQTDLFYLVENDLKMSGGDAIINLRIEGKNDIVEGIAPLLTYGLFFGRTYSISGDIIKFK
ncbi:MAG: hypothetical protein Q7K21_00755 [Elusimicrobiota bacterium]|nr:hypothetical protein [Elusimicrobiota bacterium]